MNLKTTSILLGVSSLCLQAMDVGRLSGEGIADGIDGEYANINGMR